MFPTSQVMPAFGLIMKLISSDNWKCRKYLGRYFARKCHVTRFKLYINCYIKPITYHRTLLVPHLPYWFCGNLFLSWCSFSLLAHSLFFKVSLLLWLCSMSLTSTELVLSSIKNSWDKKSCSVWFSPCLFKERKQKEWDF